MKIIATMLLVVLMLSNLNARRLNDPEIRQDFDKWVEKDVIPYFKGQFQKKKPKPENPYEKSVRQNREFYEKHFKDNPNIQKK